MPKFSGPPIETKGETGNIFVMLAITTSRMRRFDVSQEEITKLQDIVTKSTSYEGACNALREWFPLDVDLLTLNNCIYGNKCQYPGCPKTCKGREHVKSKVRQYNKET